MNTTINKTAVSIAAGLAGTLFIGYCIYFDSKRRADPDYKKKIRERRRRYRQTAGRNGIPNLSDHEAIERYFLQEIQWGETLIARGEFENGVGHLANAIIVCGQPGRLLEILQMSLPSQVFAMLILKMQELGNRAKADVNDKPKIVMVKSIESADNMNEIYGSQSTVLIDNLE